MAERQAKTDAIENNAAAVPTTPARSAAVSNQSQPQTLSPSATKSEREAPQKYHAQLHETDLLRDARDATVEYDATPPKVTREEVAHIPGAFILHGILSEAECRQYIELAESLDFKPSPLRNLGTVNSQKFSMATQIRKSDRVLLDAPPPIADVLDLRVQPHLPPTVECTFDQVPQRWALVTQPQRATRVVASESSSSSAAASSVADEAAATALALGPLNRRWRFGRYEKGGYFRPHYDAGFEYSDTEKTLLTFIMYLNDGFEGGQTVFFPNAHQAPPSTGPRDPGQIPKEVPVTPRAGSCLVFFQAGRFSPLHEGREVLTENGRKYILRSDVAYRVVEDLPNARPSPSRPAVCLLL